uniref:Uncharacterized protein n=1 Tax=Noctiluca scintillans TaxID=2966 RepID=A0A7S1FC87_NOCSC|mmetsp:Transcript_52527/g.139880  ORF Transcript_52527/g.139880 Transcript_52527/m.139880 type:complete len:557 (+) Transcript_52527:59-1729(+)
MFLFAAGETSNTSGKRCFSLFAVALVVGGSLWDSLHHVAKVRHNPDVLDAAFLELVFPEIAQQHRVTARTPLIEATMQNIFQALPKNGRGTLGGAALRTLLHRFFLNSRGYVLKGLEPGGVLWNGSVSVDLLSEGVPKDARELLDSRLHEHGSSLADSALLASLVLEMVLAEERKVLTDVYESLGMSLQDALGDSGARKVLNLFSQGLVFGGSIKELAEWDVDQETLTEIYSAWPEVLTFVGELHRSVVSDQSVVTFDDMLSVVWAIHERFGQWQNRECNQVKDQLYRLHGGRTGRVLISDFYGGRVLDEQWPFLESGGYLRQLGALDVEHTLEPRVIVPNYMYSLSNCVTMREHFSICCLDACESILASVEMALGSPRGLPEDIIDVVSGSSVVESWTNLVFSGSLRQRLYDVAASHGGLVPIHGRLFRQWLHHAYPLECAFPHMSGTVRPLTEEDYVLETGVDPRASVEEIFQRIDDATPRWRREKLEVEDLESVLWIAEEETLDTSEVQTCDQICHVFQFLVLAVAGACGYWMSVAIGQSHSGNYFETKKHYV